MTTFFEDLKIKTGVDLSPPQKEAVLNNEGVTLLLASPGSGKTTTIIMKMGYLIQEAGYLPNEILGVTFTKASAMDMKDRYHKFFKTEAPNLSTIHSFAYRILVSGMKKRGIDWTLSTSPKWILIKVFKTLFNSNLEEDQFQEATAILSLIKNKMMTEREIEGIQTQTFENVLEVYKEYEKERLIPNEDGEITLDFDDILLYTLDFLKTDKELRENVQNHYRYVLTDESQDTSLVQHKIIEILVQKHKNLCIVADDDQSIYLFRGAEPQYLLDIKQIYPDTKIIHMTENYRSGKMIVDVANKFIKLNKNRYEKEMFSSKKEQGEIIFRDLPSKKAEIGEIIKEVKEKEDRSETAILFRKNSSVILLANELYLNNLPFYIKETNNPFFSNWITKDILSFFKYSMDLSNREAFLQVFPKLKSYLKKDERLAIRQAILEADEDMPINRIIYECENVEFYKLKTIIKALEMIYDLKEKDPIRGITFILDKLKYQAYLNNFADFKGYSPEYVDNILFTLMEIANTTSSIEGFLKRMQILENLFLTSLNNKGQLNLSTFHSSKGLEFDEVYMIDCVKGITPSASSMDDPILFEEERRLFYVAATRAKKRLKIYSYGIKSSFVRDFSKIYDTLNQKLINDEIKRLNKKAKMIESNSEGLKDLLKGDKIIHKTFGTGVIVDQNQFSIVIDFEMGERKTIFTDIAISKQLLTKVI